MPVYNSISYAYADESNDFADELLVDIYCSICKYSKKRLKLRLNILQSQTLRLESAGALIVW